jgi:hypothetical protein
MQRVAVLNGMLIMSVPDGVAEPFLYNEERTKHHAAHGLVAQEHV